MATIPKYPINLPQFNGPLDLLLHLIEREELNIAALSLSQVTEQYLESVNQLQDNKIEQLIDFIVVGARLVLIKSRALLPKTPVSADGLAEDEEEEDPAEALIRQLKRYKQFKTAAQWLAQRQDDGMRSYLRIAPPPKIEKKLDLQGLTLSALATAVYLALQRAEQLEESVSVVQPRRITIEGQISHLRNNVKNGVRIPFHSLLSSRVDRVEISVTLLAVLELMKRHEISASQQTMFGPIEIFATPTDPTTPPPHQ